jgi:hypothetical protein
MTRPHWQATRRYSLRECRTIRARLGQQIWLAGAAAPRPERPASSSSSPSENKKRTWSSRDGHAPPRLLLNTYSNVGLAFPGRLGVAKLTKGQRESLVEKRILRVLSTLTVANQRTLEQKISDAGPGDQRCDPHIITTVRERLEHEDVIASRMAADAPWYFASNSRPEAVTRRLDELVAIYGPYATCTTGSGRPWRSRRTGLSARSLALTFSAVSPIWRTTTTRRHTPRSIRLIT